LGAVSFAWPSRSTHSRPLVQCGTASPKPSTALTVSITRDAPRSETPAVNTNCTNRHTVNAP